ncbi:MAG: hypothetical protein MUP11_01645 [Anaerolineales bacterium]|nr:hypothetical protein [Anaerolineales bacterium]
MEKGLYSLRTKRFEDAVSLKGPDRVPVIPIGVQFFDTIQAGLSNKQAMYETERRYQIWQSFVSEYQFDMAPAIGCFPAGLLESIGAKHYLWPGGGLSDQLPFQYVEKEYMLQEEYDQLLADPADFTCRVIWPRKSKLLEPAGKLPPLHWFGLDPLLLGAYLTDPEMLVALEGLIQMGRKYQEWVEIDTRYSGEIEGAGYPITYKSAYGHTAFDILADYYRGLRGIMLDMYRVPEKLLAAIDLFTDMEIDWTIADAEYYGNPRVPLWLHRGQDSFMSPEQYERFYWPSLQKLILALVEAGLTPIAYFQGDNTSRLPFMAELPAGKVPLHFDIIDRKKAREIIGGKQCFWGNVPSSILVTGTPQQVKEDVRELIDLFAETGGLIIDSSSGIPDEAKPENLSAMVDTILELYS